MKVSAAVPVQCRERGIKIESRPTSVTAQRFNQTVEEGAAVAACFHLSC